MCSSIYLDTIIQSGVRARLLLMFKTSPSFRPLLVSSHCNEAAQVCVRSTENKAALLLGGRFLVAEVLAVGLLAVFGFRNVRLAAAAAT